jgi:hypothetical protein
MAKGNHDDLEAVRTIVATLEPCESKDQERILRWAREKLGLSVAPAADLPADKTKGATSEHEAKDGPNPAAFGKVTDIRSFIENKKPQSDGQFAAAVAYYYRFEAPEPQRKDAISSADLQEACRQTGRERLKSPAQTLVNTHNQGYLNKGTERGTYVINTVGENLVAMALPDGVRAAASTSKRPKPGSGKKRPR